MYINSKKLNNIYHTQKIKSKTNLSFWYPIKFKKNLVFNKDNTSKFSQNLEINHTKISQKYSNDDVIKILLHFTSEKPFIKTTQKKTNNALKVLSKAAFHKMDDTSPVTADQNRGNFYTR